MEDSYISNRDKIVASAIELIGDLGLHALTPKNLARKQNISDTLIYKYFGLMVHILIRSDIMRIHMRHIMIII